MNIGPRLRAFLEEPLPVVLGTTRRDKSVQMTPLWYEYRDGQICLNGAPRPRPFLAHPLPAVPAPPRRDKSVRMTPLWYEFRDGQIWLNGGPRRDWFKHLKRDGHATLLLVDNKNMFSWAQIQGRLADATFEGADEHIDHLSQRFNGRPYPAPKVERMIVRIDPERITGGENRQPWDVAP